MSTSTTTALCPKCDGPAYVTWTRLSSMGRDVVREDPTRFSCENGCTMQPLELSKHFKGKGPAGV